MKFSLKAKFYLFVFPLVVVLPLLLYSLAAPYSQMRVIFSHFQTDATIAIDAQILYQAIEEEQLQTYHYISSLPDADAQQYSTESQKSEVRAKETLAHLYQRYSDPTIQDTELTSEEKQSLDSISADFDKLNSQLTDAKTIAESGRKDDALDILRESTDDLVDTSLKPSLEQFVNLKQNEVKNSLPLLISLIERFGVVPIPGVQNNIKLISLNLEHAIDAQNFSRLVDDQQIELFHIMLSTNDASLSATERQKDTREFQIVADQTTSLISDLKKEFPLENETSSEEVRAVQTLDTNYQQLSKMIDQTLEYSVQKKRAEGLDYLADQVDTYVDTSLDPAIETLTASNQQDVVDSIESLNHQLQILVLTIYILCILVALIGIGSLFSLSRTIINPIIALRDAVRRIANGELSFRVHVNTKDEIGQLAESFNTMTDSLQASYHTLEEKVTDRTNELTEKVTELEDTKKATLNLLEDLDEEKIKLKEKEAQLVDAQQAGGIGSYSIDLQTNTLDASEEMMRLYGLDPNGKKPSLPEIIALVYPEDQKSMIDGLQQIAKNADIAAGTFEQSYRVEYKDKSMHWLRTKGQINFSESKKPIEIVGTVQDVTKEHEVDRMKTEFISLASHQLRTPLTAVKWFTEMLLDGDSGPLSPEILENVKNISDSNQRMIELVNSLLNISRIESGRLIIEPVETDLSELLSGVIKELRPRFDLKHQQAIVSVHPNLPKISIDAKLIRQVYINFLTNAIKYSPENAEISVFISLKDNEVISQVSDTGYGIPKAEQNKVFQKFFRAQNIVPIETDGNGLGLYLVKAIIEASGGRTWFESEEGKGTSFWFSLPTKGSLSHQGEVRLDS